MGSKTDRATARRVSGSVDKFKLTAIHLHHSPRCIDDVDFWLFYSRFDLESHQKEIGGFQRLHVLSMQKDRATVLALEKRCTAAMVKMPVRAQDGMWPQPESYQFSVYLDPTESRIDQGAAARTRSRHRVAVRCENASGDSPYAFRLSNNHRIARHFSGRHPGTPFVR